MQKFKFYNPFITFMDWYIKKYHTDKYVHISNIADVIEKRIDSAIVGVNKINEQKIIDALEIERRKNQIEIAGYIAELKSKQKIVEEAESMKREVQQLYYRVKYWGKQLLYSQVDSKDEREEICNTISATIGKLDKHIVKTERINKEIEDNREQDENILRLK